MSYNFLLVSWGTLGNLSPMLTAARRLRQNGHHIRVMADPAMRSEVEASGFEFVTWRRAPTGTAADPVDVSDMSDFLRRAIFGPAALYAADMRDEIDRVPTDAVLVLDALFGARSARRHPVCLSRFCRLMSAFGRCRECRRSRRA